MKVGYLRALTEYKHEKQKTAPRWILYLVLSCLQNILERQYIQDVPIPCSWTLFYS